MVDFEKIGDTFEDGFDKVKDFTKKNKVLTIAIVGVGAFALYKFFTDKTNSQDNEYVSTYAYVPTGYDGYPTMSESVSYDDVVNQLREETSDINKDFYDEIMSGVSQQIEDISKIVEDNQNINKPIIIGTTGYNSNLSTGSYLEEQRIIEQMKANSEAWYGATDEEKERLHNENEYLGSLLGGSFDSGSGTWYKDGQTLYDVSTKNKTNTSTANLTNVGVTETTVSQNDIVAQMKANSEAWHGASESERKRLEEENQRLGSQIGASFDSGSGTWTNSSGGSLYTVSSGASKNTSSTSTNVSSGSTSSGSKSSSSSSGSKSSSSGSTATVTNVTKNSDGTYTHTWSNGKTTVQTQKNGGLVLSRK